MVHWWFALAIALGTMVIDWAIFALVGNHVAGKLTKVAEQAVLKGADEVKNSLNQLTAATGSPTQTPSTAPARTSLG